MTGNETPSECRQMAAAAEQRAASKENARAQGRPYPNDIETSRLIAEQWNRNAERQGQQLDAADALDAAEATERQQ